MKTSPYYPQADLLVPTSTLTTGAHQPDVALLGTPAQSYSSVPSTSVRLTPRSQTASILTEASLLEMEQGTLPDLRKLVDDLYLTFFQHQRPHSALQFIPVLKAFQGLDREAEERFLQNPKTNHVLIKNELLKVVLIHWTPNKISSVHGHAEGGCLFKVLQGRLMERRYSPDTSQQLLAVSNFQAGSMAYIDDEMAYHDVGNPYNAPAISLHVYTPGI